MNTPTPQTDAPNSAAPKSNRGRRLGLLSLARLGLVGGLVYGVYWFINARHFETTDDAYVNGDVVQVSSQQPGTVLAVHVDDTQTVAAGTAVVELDPADADVAMSNAEAELARSVRQVRGLFAQGAQLSAQIDQRESALRTAESDLKRRQGLLDDGAISGEELSHARDNVISMRAAVAAAREQLAQTFAQTQGTRIDNHPQVLAAAAAVRNAALAVRRTKLVAPVGGVIAKRSVEVGQRIAPGTPLLAVVPLDDVWIDANFKEVQLSHMHTGQPVIVRADLYGSDVEFHGRLVGVGAGSACRCAYCSIRRSSNPIRCVLDSRRTCAWTFARALRRGRRAWYATRRSRCRPASLMIRPSTPSSRGSLRKTPASSRARRRERRHGEHPAASKQRRSGPHCAGPGARYFHAGTGHQHRQRLDSDHCRGPRRQLGPGHLGHHLICRVERCVGAADRLAHAALRRGAHVCAVGPRLYRDLITVRPVLEPALAYCFPRAAGRRLGAHDSRQPGAAAQYLRAGQARHRAGHLVHHRAGGAERRAGARRLHFRQLQLALDLLHQRSGGRVLRLRLLALSALAGDSDTQTTHRRRRHRPAGGLGRSAADHARQGQGSRLVSVHADL